MKWFESFDGTRIAYREWGRPGRPPVVLHHGFIVDATINWVMPGIVEALQLAGRRVIALDARGHGASDKPHDDECYGETTMARDVTALLDVLRVPEVDLVGYSMGAIVSVIAATREPRIRRLVVGGVGAAVVEVGGLDSRVLPPAELADALLADDADVLPDSEPGRFRRYAELVGADLRALAAQARMAHAAPIPLDRITVPTLVLCGRDDPLAARPEVLAAAIPGATLTVLPGDHLGVVRDPGFAPAIVDFVTAAAVRR